jgi:hypothetical protein
MNGLTHYDHTQINLTVSDCFDIIDWADDIIHGIDDTVDLPPRKSAQGMSKGRQE